MTQSPTLTNDTVEQRKSRLAARRAHFSTAKQAELERLLKKGLNGDSPSVVIQPRPSSAPPLASLAQERLWFLDQLEPGSAVYNIPMAFQLTGKLQLDALRQSLGETIRRHESLRTNFTAVDGSPQQVVACQRATDLPVVDLEGLSTREIESEALRHAIEHGQRPFSLDHDALLRTTLLRVSSESHILLVAMHHIVSDGWSIRILIQEITTLYRCLSDGAPSPLPPLAIQYADYAHWQRQTLQGKTLESEISYWRAQLESSPAVSNLPTDRPRPASMRFHGKTQWVVIGEKLTGLLRGFSQDQGVTLFVTLLSAFYILLGRYSGEDDVVVGSPVAGRRWIETEALIGLFINTLVLRARLHRNLVVKEFLTQVQETVLEAQTHQDVPFEKLVEQLRPVRSLGHAPLFQVMFVLQNIPTKELDVEGLTLSEMPFDPSVEKFDLTLNVSEEQHQLTCAVSYNTDLFDEATIRRMVSHWQRILESLSSGFETRILAIPLLDSQERQHLLSQWNQTAVEYPAHLIHEWIEEQAANTPAAIAVQYEDRQLTYCELNLHANRLAHYLRKEGIGPDVCAGICAERSLELIVGLLAILKAGGAYLPLDSSYPTARLAAMAEDAGLKVVLIQHKFTERLRGVSSARLVELDGDWTCFGAEAESNPRIPVPPESRAYVIYTSGSTGTPKGAMNTHYGIRNRLAWMQQEYALNPSDRVLQKTPLGFDVSVWELFWPLMVGAQLVMARPGGHQDPEYLAETISQRKITTLHFVPSMLRAFLDSGAADKCASLRRIICSGEALAPDLAQQCIERVPAALHNLYGPTEAAVDVTHWNCRAEELPKGVAIGKPIANTQVYVLDPEMEPVPMGVPGELYLGGAGLARGYLNAAALTADRFVPDPFSHPGARLYRTGDWVRWRADGNLEFIGRKDQQIKLRGNRIELGEIETVLRRHDAIRDAAVVLDTNNLGDPWLAAYMVPSGDRPPANAELRQYLQERLPDYMVPSVYIELGSLPLTASGKLDRRALPKTNHVCHDAGEPFSQPRTPVEQVLSGIWAAVLGLEKVGRTDNFFWIGGHSLLATRVVSRLRDAFQIEFSVRTLFEVPTLADLAARIETSMQARSGRSVPPLERVSRSQDLPLSFAQQRLWFLDQLNPNSNAYNIPAAVEINIDISVPALEQAIAEVIRRHETLRTTFPILGGHPRQAIGHAGCRALPLVDINGLPEDERAQEARRLASEQALKPFDLSTGHPLRVCLVVQDRQRLIELVTIHHIVSDAWSMELLKTEIESLYGGFASGLPSPLPSLEIQYADYAVWQRQWLQGDVLNAELDYWRRRLAGAPVVLDLATDYPRQTSRTLAGAHCPVSFSAQTSATLNEFSRKVGATAFMTLMAAYQALLSRYTGQEDILVGTPISGRNHLALESMIGFFVNTVVLRVDLAAAASFKELVEQVRESALGAYAHQELPFDKIVEELRPQRVVGRNPLFQALFVLQNQETPGAEAGANVSAGSASHADTKFDLEAYFWESQHAVTGSFVYSPELFQSTTMVRMVRHFELLVEKALAGPDVRLSDLVLMDEAEFAQVICEWNKTAVTFPANRCVHELFEEQAAKTPDAIALQSTEEQLSYEELDQRSNRLANYLRRHSVGPEVFVGVLIPRSVEMIVAQLAISKAGGIYVPINVVEPARRIGFIVRDARISILLTVASLTEGLEDLGTSLLRLDSPEFQREIASQSSTRPDSGVVADNLIYMMYTSGSTGTPKGVCVSHRSVLRLVIGSNFAVMSSNEVYLQLTPSSFDVSTFEIWGCLLHGGRLVLAPPNTLSLGELGEFIARMKITTMWLTGGLFHQMVDGNLQGLSTVSQLLAGGEALSPQHVYKVIDTLSSCKVINGYGPTEATTFACCYTVEKNRRGATVPIGRPIANTTAYVLNQAMQPVAIGERGELFIGGVGVARGYFNRPDLTAARFVPDPLSGEQGERLYRTGDLCRYLDDGNIEFLGRVDNQIKLRGLRIELGEIEAELQKHPAVRQAVVLPREDTPGNKRLIAYVAAEAGLSGEVLKDYLKDRLPYYMVPAACVVLNALPLNANGKLDKSALPAPDRTFMRSERALVGARDVLERELVQMWEEILDIRPIGVQDDFFELGGHSLVAVQLVARIEERLGKRVPMAGLFQEATIERLAQFLREETTAQTSSLLVPIQPNGAAPPLFCVHAAGGHVFCYADLSRYMGQDQPLYGIQESPDADQIAQVPLESLAAEYVTAIRSFRPAGPYLLAGWSLGGVIAFEIARQLEAQGQKPALLALIDAEAPDPKLPEYNWVILLGSFAFDLGIPAETLRASWSEISSRPPMEQLRRVWMEAKRTGKVPADITLVAFRRLFDSFKAKAHMMRSYAGGVYHGRITLFRAVQPLEYIGEKTPENYYTDVEPTKGWKQWTTDGVEVHTMPGQHYTIMREPHVKDLAEQLRICLHDAAKGT